MMNKKIILLLPFMLLLTSCLSPVKTDTGATYMLYRVPDCLPKKRMRDASILVAMPNTSSAYDTTQMAYTTRPYQISYYSQNSWAETPAEMIEPLIVHTLQKSRYFRTVVAAPYAGRYQYFLSTRILMLERDFTREPSVIRFKMRAQLSNALTGRVIKTKEFKVEQPTRDCTPYSGVLAANAAVSKVLAGLAIFSRENAR
jgi:cholesterol transport system auxiliary component